MGQQPSFEVLSLECVAGPAGAVTKLLPPEAISRRPVAEAYLSSVLPGKVKGWTLHRLMTLRIVVVTGAVRFELRGNAASESTAIHLLANDGKMLVVPPGVWLAFRSTSQSESAVILNLPDRRHDPAESVKLAYHENAAPRKC